MKKVLILLMFICVGLLNADLKQAERHFELKEYDKAIAILEELTPSYRTMIALSGANFLNKDYKNAIEYLEEAKKFASTQREMSELGLGYVFYFNENEELPKSTLLKIKKSFPSLYKKYNFIEFRNANKSNIKYKSFKDFNNKKFEEYIKMFKFKPYDRLSAIKQINTNAENEYKEFKTKNISKHKSYNDFGWERYVYNNLINGSKSNFLGPDTEGNQFNSTKTENKSSDIKPKKVKTYEQENVKPSYNCKYARSYVEKRVCANSELAKLDNKLAKKQADKLSKVSSKTKREIERTKIKWIKKRDFICEDEEDSCIAKMYNKRIKELDKYKEEKVKKSVKKKDVIDFSNDFLEGSIFYKLEDDRLKLEVTVYNIYKDAPGGLSISFPQLRDENRLLYLQGKWVKNLKSYPENTKVWHKTKRKAIRSTYLLVESWEKSFKSDKPYKIMMSINMKGLDALIVNTRAVIKDKKREILLPMFGERDQQNYPVKQIVIENN